VTRKEEISTRIKDGLQAAKKRGVKLGKHGKRVLSKENKKAATRFVQKMLPVIKQLQADGYNNIRALTEELNRRNLPTYRGQGNQWHLRSTNRLLKRLKPESLKSKPQPVKWVGGKRSIVKILKGHMPDQFNNYYEPFFGGGALYFSIHQTLKKAYLSDVNPDLITLYQVIQNEPRKLVELLKSHSRNHSEEYYYSLRAKHKIDDPIEVAARMLYLNKTCYNGLWRVNKKGEFNASMGRYDNPEICNAATLKSCCKALKGAKIRQMDYRNINPKRGDFVYFDPPYHSLQENSFTSYSQDGFSEKDQIRLARFCMRLHKRGIKWMLSNSDTEVIRKLYSSSVFTIHIIKAARMINSDATARQPAEEVLITNY